MDQGSFICVDKVSLIFNASCSTANLASLLEKESFFCRLICSLRDSNFYLITEIRERHEGMLMKSQFIGSHLRRFSEFKFIKYWKYTKSLSCIKCILIIKHLVWTVKYSLARLISYHQIAATGLCPALTANSHVVMSYTKIPMYKSWED